MFFLTIFALWSSNCNNNFDVEFLKLLVLIDLLLRDMGMLFVQRN